MPPFDAEAELLRHGAAQRELALALVGDSSRADDAVRMDAVPGATFGHEV